MAYQEIFAGDVLGEPWRHGLKRRLRVVGILALIIGGTLWAVPTAAKAASWSIQPTPNPVGSTNSVLYGVSCTSARTCIAVGGASSGALAERWNGIRWSILPTPPESPVLYGVSCISARACTAVGEATGGLTRAERWNGISWQIQPTPSQPGYFGVPAGQLAAVSCTSLSACMAVGSGYHSVFAEQWNGNAWTLQSLPAPPGTGISYNLQLTAVSCTSANACTAVGFNGNPDLTLAEQWNGSVWQQQTSQTPPIPGGIFYGAFEGVSCTSVIVCSAVGNTLLASTSYQLVEGTLAESWNGADWAIQSTPTLAGASSLNSVSCTSANACTAVGAAGVDTLAERWRSSRRRRFWGWPSR